MGVSIHARNKAVRFGRLGCELASKLRLFPNSEKPSVTCSHPPCPGGSQLPKIEITRYQERKEVFVPSSTCRPCATICQCPVKVPLRAVPINSSYLQEVMDSRHLRQESIQE